MESFNFESCVKCLFYHLSANKKQNKIANLKQKESTWIFLYWRWNNFFFGKSCIFQFKDSTNPYISKKWNLVCFSSNYILENDFLTIFIFAQFHEGNFLMMDSRLFKRPPATCKTSKSLFLTENNGVPQSIILGPFFLNGIRIKQYVRSKQYVY